MKEVIDLIFSPNVQLAASLLVAVAVIGMAMRVLVNPRRDCDCPRYLLERQNRGGLVWKTRHRVDCEGFGS